MALLILSSRSSLRMTFDGSNLQASNVARFASSMWQAQRDSKLQANSIEVEESRCSDSSQPPRFLM